MLKTATVSDFKEETKVKENVEILRQPVTVSDDQGRAIGTASIQRHALTDYKTKQPTGEKLVYLVFTPGEGRAVKVRLMHAVNSLAALGFIADEDDEDDEEIALQASEDADADADKEGEGE